jgi:hypothetical protein
MPAIARPMMNAIEFGAAPQTAECNYIQNLNAWTDFRVRRKGGTEHLFYPANAMEFEGYATPKRNVEEFAFNVRSSARR